MRSVASRDSLTNLTTYAGTLLRNGAALSKPHLALRQLLLPAEVLVQLPDSGEVIIIPHGSVGLVPFAALPMDTTGTPFGSRFAVRYAPSLATLGVVSERPGLRRSARAAALREALVVGNPAFPDSIVHLGEIVRLARLPGAAAEAESVAAHLGTGALTGSAATKAAVRQHWSRAPVIHLATHGRAYSTDATVRSSWIALAPSPGDDALLTVGEILDDERYRLSAELVVLSACETGLGDLRQSEGTVGLQRALLARGARSVLVSLWRVSDEATALLMDRFYAHWLDDPDAPTKAEALRRAQQDVRGQPGSRFYHPRYWAAFQLVGAP